MAEFDYIAPSSLEVTLHLLNNTSRPHIWQEAHGLLPDMRANNIQPTTLIDLPHLNTFKYIRLENHHIDIGARTTLAEVKQNQLIQHRQRATPRPVGARGGLGSDGGPLRLPWLGV